MAEGSRSESDRVAVVLRSIVEHLDYARHLAHDLVNSVDPNTLPITVIASEQAVEMDLRHAETDLADVRRYWPTAGGTT